MAVQKSRVTRSKRGMRRAHHSLSPATLSVDQATGETHRRHHVSPEGYYKGELIVDKSVAVDSADDSDEE